MNEINKTKISTTDMLSRLFDHTLACRYCKFDIWLGDSPLLRTKRSDDFIGVMALFIVRYGMKGKYLAALLIITAVGLYQSFSHYGNHAHFNTFLPKL